MKTFRALIILFIDSNDHVAQAGAILFNRIIEQPICERRTFIKMESVHHINDFCAFLRTVFAAMRVITPITGSLFQIIVPTAAVNDLLQVA